MKKIFAFLNRFHKNNVRESLAIKSCIPLSFGVMFKCDVICDVALSGGDKLILINGKKRCETVCINIEKDYIVSVEKVSCETGNEVCITAEYTEGLKKFPLRGTLIAIK